MSFPHLLSWAFSCSRQWIRAPNDKRRLPVFHGLLATDIHSAKEFMSLWDYLENWPNELSFCIEQTIRNKTQKMHHIQDFIKHIILQGCRYTQFTSSSIKTAQVLFFFLIRKGGYQVKILSHVEWLCNTRLFYSNQINKSWSPDNIYFVQKTYGLDEY